MSDLKFRQQGLKVEVRVREILEVLSGFSDTEIKNLVSDFEQFWSEYQKQTQLTIALIGQYNAGKSTIIKALTGDPTVRISAEICTDKVTEYPWREVLLVDTPGIYAGKVDHDQITLDKISKSDLLIFVVPNELFNPQGGAFFKRLAEDMQRVGQMVLVVNKMSRESGTHKILISTLLKVIEPYHPSDFYTCFIDADSYLQAHYEQEEEEKLFLIEESNFDNFLNSLQTLIEKNHLSARLTTPLHRAVDLLEQAYNVLSTGDKTTRDLLEILRRKAVILRASQTRARNIYRAELNQLEHKIIMVGERVASKIDGHHGEDEINSEITNSQQEIDLVSQQYIEKIQSNIKSEFENLGAKIQELKNSTLGRIIARELEIDLGEKKKFKDQNFGVCGTANFLGMGSEVLKGIGGFASKASRDIVYNVGKSIGIKFKPFGAFKAAKFIRGLGPVIAGLGVFIDIALTAKQEQDEAKYKQKLRQARLEVRQDYRKVADEIKNEYEFKFEEVLKFYDEELWDVDLKRNQLTNNEESKRDIVAKINNKLKDLKTQISLVTQFSSQLTKEDN
ncbi:MAG TPA: GTPase [Stenomitos sp.]